MGDRDALAAQQTSTRDLAVDELRRPGKGTLVSSNLQHPCDGMQGPACALTVPERADARLQLVQRIAAAGAAWGDACLELRIAKLLERDEPEPVLVMLLDVLSSVATGGLSQALRRIDPSGFSDGAMRGLMRTAVSSVRPLLAVQHERERVRQYLGDLSEAGASALQSLTGDVLARATDAELTAWLEAFDSSHHSVSIYRRALEEQILRFERSGVTDLGDRAVRNPTKGIEEILVRRAKAAWLVYPNGVRELAIVSTDFETWGSEFFDPRDDSFGNTHVHVLSPEFVSIAMSEHARTWHTPPRDIPVKAGMPTLQLHDVPGAK